VLDEGGEIGCPPAKSARGLGALQDAARACGGERDRAVALKASFGLLNSLFTVLKLHKVREVSRSRGILNIGVKAKAEIEKRKAEIETQRGILDCQLKRSLSLRIEQGFNFGG
jgi:hypothetical protein